MIRFMLTAAVMLVAGAAQAQYAPYPPQAEPYIPYAEVPRDDQVFSGLRVEAHLSYDRLVADLDDDETVFGNRRSGLGYGGEVGFDLPLGGITLGAYAGADGSTIRECAARTAGTLCLRLGRSLYAGGRIGVPIDRSVLLYARGGYTNGQLRGEGIPAAAPTTAILTRQDRDGFHLGGGVEVALAPRAYGKVEYVYTKLRAPRDNLSGDSERQQVQGGVGLRF